MAAHHAGKADVLVIGAGAAGLAAAAELVRSGRRVVVLEARERIGGRCFTRFEHGLPIPIELGAEFIHGQPEATLALLRAAGSVAVDSGRVQRVVEEGRLRPVDGFAEARKAMRDIASLRKMDLSFERFLSSRKRLSARTRRFARLMVEGFDAADPKRASARVIAAEWTSGESLGASQPRPLGGYGPLLEFLANLVEEGKGSSLRLGAIVRRVQWRPGFVEVSGTSGGKPFTARAPRTVISLPLGVLQAGTVVFQPALQEKKAALKALVSGPVVKAALHFHAPFWEHIDRGRYREVAFFHSPSAPFPTFWTPLPMRAPVLVGWAGGPKATRLAGKREETVIDALFASLRSIFRMDMQSLLASVMVHDWQSDPFARGAYSYVGVDGAGAREILAAPMERTLFFAGEATDTEGEAGTVAGALQSGMRAAQAVLTGT